MEKRVEDAEKVENKVENELKVKCPPPKKKRTDKKNKTRKKKSICMIHVKKSSSKVKLKQNK